MKETHVREEIVGLLRRKGYSVRSIATGSGVPKNSRLELAKDGKRLTCAVKVSEGGRISFTRDENGTYRVLSEADLVIHATPGETGGVVVSAFAGDRVVRAFEENFKALSEHGMGHIPLWVNPAPEGGWRLTGSGFGRDAIWRDTIPEGSPPAVTEAAKDAPVPDRHSTGLVDELKRIASEWLGVSPSAIEIDIRFKG